MAAAAESWRHHEMKAMAQWRPIAMNEKLH